MATYSDLQAQIATELARDDLTTPIQSAILAAVRHYQRKLSLFAQATQSVTTVAGTAEYALNADFVAFDFVTLLDNDQPYRLNVANYAELVSKDTIGERSKPGEYGYRNYQLRLCPIPDAAYDVTVYYWKSATAPSAAGDSLVWTNDLLDLIRFRAKTDIAANTLMDLAGAQQYKAQEYDILDGIIAQRDRLLSATAAVELTEF